MQKIKILFLAVDPSKQTQLDLDEEVRAINQILRSVRYRDAFELIPALAVRPDDLQELLLEHEPQVVHFSGHGTDTAELVMKGPDGDAQRVDEATLVDLFEAFQGKVRLVILNACHTESQARVLARVVGAAIGMSAAVPDKDAIRFAAAFYRALGFGQDLRTAFRLGLNAIKMASESQQRLPAVRNLVSEEVEGGPGVVTAATIPRLHVDEGDGSQIRLVDSPEDFELAKGHRTLPRWVLPVARWGTLAAVLIVSPWFAGLIGPKVPFFVGVGYIIELAFLLVALFLLPARMAKSLGWLLIPGAILLVASLIAYWSSVQHRTIRLERLVVKGTELESKALAVQRGLVALQRRDPTEAELVDEFLNQTDITDLTPEQLVEMIWTKSSIENSWWALLVRWLMVCTSYALCVAVFVRMAMMRLSARPSASE